MLNPKSIRVSVISPSLFVTGADCGVSSVHSEPEVSLDWDGFAENPSFGAIGAARAATGVEAEVSEITGIEDIKKITLVDTSVSSLSSHSDQNLAIQEPINMSDQERLAQQMIEENASITLLRDNVYDKIEFFNASKVRKGNIAIVNSNLREIHEAKVKFKAAVKNYQKTFTTFHPDNCNALQHQLDKMNSDVNLNEDEVWSKVEKIQSEQSPPTPSNSGGGGGGLRVYTLRPPLPSPLGTRETLIHWTWFTRRMSLRIDFFI